MLVVQRKIGERIVLDGGIEITLVATGRGGARLAIRAPKDVWVARGEVHDAIVRANAAAAETAASILAPAGAPTDTSFAQGTEVPRTEDSQ